MATIGRSRIGTLRFDPSPSAAEREFHGLVHHLVCSARARGEPPEQIRRRLVREFLDEPNLRRADVYEQEHVVAGLQRTIEAALATP